MLHVVRQPNGGDAQLGWNAARGGGVTEEESKVVLAYRLVSSQSSNCFLAMLPTASSSCRSLANFMTSWRRSPTLYPLSAALAETSGSYGESRDSLSHVMLLEKEPRWIKWTAPPTHLSTHDSRIRVKAATNPGLAFFFSLDPPSNDINKTDKGTFFLSFKKGILVSLVFSKYFSPDDGSFS